MSLMVPFRSLNRSAKFDVGGKTFSTTVASWLNLENSRARRDLARHTTLGQLVQTGVARYQFDSGTVSQGLQVTARAAGDLVDISEGAIVLANGTEVLVTARTLELAGQATDPRLVAVGIDTTTPGSPTAVQLAGTALAGLTRDRALSGAVSWPAVADATFPALSNTANRTWLALVFLPAQSAAATATATTDVIALTSHGYSAGQQVRLTSLTGGTGLTAGNTYYVLAIDANSFKLSNTLGGTAVDVTADGTSLIFDANLTSDNVSDIRP